METEVTFKNLKVSNINVLFKQVLFIVLEFLVKQTNDYRFFFCHIQLYCFYLVPATVSLHIILISFLLHCTYITKLSCLVTSYKVLQFRDCSSSTGYFTAYTTLTANNSFNAFYYNATLSKHESKQEFSINVLSNLSVKLSDLTYSVVQ